MTASESRPIVILAAALTLAGGCGCSQPSALDAGTDGGRDAGNDGGADSGRDAGRDGGVDADLPDGSWTPVVDVPIGCMLMQATPPLLAATTWPVEPCPDRAGCRRIAPVRDVPRFTVPFRVEREHGAHDGTRGVIAVFGDTGPWTDEWIIDDRGTTLAGFRTLGTSAESTPCTQGHYDVSSTHFTFHLINGSDVVATVLYRGVLGGTPARGPDLSEPSGGTDYPQEIRIDTGRVASWLSTQRVQAIESNGALSVIAGMGIDCSASVADVIGDTIFVDCASVTMTNVYVQQPGGPLEALLDPTARSSGLDSDGTDMAWFVYHRAAPGEPIDAEIWASPHAIHAADVRARHVADVPRMPMGYPTDLRIGFGYAAALEGADLIGVYRLVDGARAELRAPAGERWNGFVQYIGPEEIAATSGVYTGPLSDRALMFIRLDSLVFVP